MCSYYDKILPTGDFNAEIYDCYLETFLYQLEFKSLVKEKNSLKSISNVSCIDLFLTNNAISLQSIKTISTIIKNKLGEMQYRNYKYFEFRKFNRDLKEKFSRKYEDLFSKFDEIFLKVLNRRAPLEKKMTIGLIMHGMCLKNYGKLL